MIECPVSHRQVTLKCCSMFYFRRENLCILWAGDPSPCTVCQNVKKWKTNKQKPRPRYQMKGNAENISVIGSGCIVIKHRIVSNNYHSRHRRSLSLLPCVFIFVTACTMHTHFINWLCSFYLWQYSSYPEVCSLLPLEEMEKQKKATDYLLYRK